MLLFYLLGFITKRDVNDLAVLIPPCLREVPAIDITSYSPTPPPRPNINHLVLPPLIPTIHDQVPIERRTGNTRMVRPHADFVAHREGHFLLLWPVPTQDAVFLADSTDLPPAMDPGEVRAWYGLSGLQSVRAPGHDVAPGGVVGTWDGAFVCYGLAAEG